ncbi:hypothetical protein ACH9DO_05090 [Kocuria sp. M1N1S27]|uniref:hypothetical protein n=1 Tax=Kocuria kalidii TaxID=3376283 RepID=UPI003790F597
MTGEGVREEGNDPDAGNAELVAMLHSRQTSVRVATLQTLMEDPTGDAAVRSSVEDLLSDRTPAVVAIPALVGEVRWLAAQALSSERRAAGIDQAVVVDDVPLPRTPTELARSATAAGLPVKGGNEGAFSSWSALVARGALATEDLVI